MMILDTTSKTIQAVLGGAVTANQLRITSHYEDITTTTYAPSSNRVVTNNTTPVTVVGSPATSTQRKVLSISIYNKDTADAAVTVQAYDGTNTDELVKVTLDPGDTLYYGNHAGWIVTDSLGRVKTVTGTGSTEPSDGDKGDITVSDLGLAWAINAGAVTLAKIVDATGQYKIMVRASSGSGDWEELSSSADVFSILGAANYAAVRSLLGLDTGNSPQFTYLTITGSIGSAILIKSLASTGAATVLELENDSPSPANGDNVIMTFKLSDDAGNQDVFADIATYADNVANGSSQAGSMLFRVLVNNALTSMLELDGVTGKIFPLVPLALQENAALELDAALSADGKYSGIVLPGQTAGAALAFGDLVYLQTSDSRWELVDANAEATCSNMLGICVLAAAGDGSATTILVYGKVRADTAFPTMTIGAKVFASTTAGDIQTTAPSGAADIIRVVGHALTADELFFNPSQDYYEHA